MAASLLDRTYPLPIVDHMQAARDARQKIYGARKGTEFRRAADAIQTKHGSRKSGIQATSRNSGRHKRLRSDKAAVGQLAMELGPIGRGSDETDR